MSMLINTKGHSSMKNVGIVIFLVFACRLMMLYICTKFGENILNGFRVMEWI